MPPSFIFPVILNNLGAGSSKVEARERWAKGLTSGWGSQFWVLTCARTQQARQPQQGPTLGLMLCCHHWEILNQSGAVETLKAADPRGFTHRDTGEVLAPMTKGSVQILYLGCRGLKEGKLNAPWCVHE